MWRGLVRTYRCDLCWSGRYVFMSKRGIAAPRLRVIHHTLPCFRSKSGRSIRGETLFMHAATVIEGRVGVYLTSIKTALIHAAVLPFGKMLSDEERPCSYLPLQLSKAGSVYIQVRLRDRNFPLEQESSYIALLPFGTRSTDKEGGFVCVHRCGSCWPGWFVFKLERGIATSWKNVNGRGVWSSSAHSRG